MQKTTSMNTPQSGAQPSMHVSAPTPIASAPPPPTSFTATKQEDLNAASKLISFSSNTNSFTTGSEFEDEEEEAMESGKKRKREEDNKDGKMMEFFEGLMKQVMERQESMQKKFMDALEKREQERLIREEAWRRQEMSRIARQNEIAANERAAVLARDAVIFSVMQKATGQAVPFPLSPQAAAAAPPPPITPQPLQQMQTQVQEIVQKASPIQPSPSPVSYELVPVTSIGSQIMDPGSSRWPKPEVHALIQLRSELDSKYHENGPKGPLWEEISSGMQKIGYNRSAKRCKEKWENINKYFRKVKESNKKRPDDAKTCPYFHQLDALYRHKQFNNSNINSGGGGGDGGGGGTLHALDQNVNLNPTPISVVAPVQQGEVENKSGNGGGSSSNGEVGSASALFGEGTPSLGADGSGLIMKKPEDIVKELMSQTSNDNMNEDEEYDEDDDNEDGKGQYRIQFQKQTSADNNASNNAEASKTSGKLSNSHQLYL